MREIKFRAWDMNTNSFAPISGIYLDETGASAGYVDDLGFVGEVAGDKPKIEQWILEQYTGLKDVNGIEVYEGDIIKLHVIVLSPDDTIGYVVYNEQFGYCLKFKNRSNGRDALLRQEYWAPMENTTYEVIGNIHETPELLEGYHEQKNKII